MSYHQNGRGEIFRTGLGGTYRVNDGNPENDDDQFDQELFDSQEEDRVDYLLSMMEE